MFIASSSESGNGSRHRYLYARVLGIFHANVMLTGPGSTSDRWERFDFLWVCWYRVAGHQPDWLSKRLDVVELAPASNPKSYAFVDPAEVLRACHIIPQFSKGPARPGQSGVSVCARDKGDWLQYFVNRSVFAPFSTTLRMLSLIRFVDRDMLMRFHWGLGVGHLYSHEDRSAGRSQDQEQIPTRRASGIDSDDEPEETTGRLQAPQNPDEEETGDMPPLVLHGDDTLDLVREAHAEFLGNDGELSDQEDAPAFILEEELEIEEEEAHVEDSVIFG
jgi:hypothetical protein